VTTAPTQHTLRIALLDDHTLLLHALSEALAQDDDKQVVLRSDGGGDVVLDLLACSPDVLLLDVNLGDRSGLDLLVEIRGALPELPVVMLSGAPDASVVAVALERGAAGFLSKSAPLSEIRLALRNAFEGRTVLPRGRLSEVVQILTSEEAHERRLGAFLTERERTILSRLAAGHSTLRIAGDLHITHHTVRTHIQNILTKLGAHSKLEAAAIGVRSQIVTPYHED
jgi:two-component system nitrate/nitrite response regulator NarL